MSLQIIKAGVSHAAVIASIGKKSFRKSFEHQFRSREELFEYLEHTYDPVKLAKSLRKENNHYFLALLHNEAVGFAKVKLHSLNEQLESIAQMELQKIYVLPERHENGAGSALLHAG
ncbi:MAG: GNAT family N-acetyltransferase [Bacteroidota bacterium]